MSRGGSSWYRREMRTGRAESGTSATAFGVRFSSGARTEPTPPRPYHERRREMACCPECLSETCHSLVCDERGGE